MLAGKLPTSRGFDCRATVQAPRHAHREYLPLAQWLCGSIVRPHNHGWTQEQLAELVSKIVLESGPESIWRLVTRLLGLGREGRTQGWVSQRLTFGRFIRYVVDITQVISETQRLTEGHFMTFSPDTTMAVRSREMPRSDNGVALPDGILGCERQDALVTQCQNPASRRPRHEG